MHAEDAARVLAVRARLAPEARRVTGVAGRELVWSQDLIAVERGERDLARTGEEQVAVVDVVHLGAVGREEARLFHRAFAHERRRDHGHEVVGDDSLHRVVDECELEQRGLAHDVREATATGFRTAHRVDEPERIGERGVVERWRVGRIPDDCKLVAFVLTAVGNGRVGGVRDLEDQLAEGAVDRLLFRFLRD